MIDASVICRSISAHMLLCALYDSNKPPNAWVTEHAKKDKNNVKNAVKFMFCFPRSSKNAITTQAELDIHYRMAMDSIKSTVRISYVGVVKVRNRFNSGVIFLDSVLELIMPRRLRLNPVLSMALNKPTMTTSVVIPRVELKKVHKDIAVNTSVGKAMEASKEEINPANRTKGSVGTSGSIATTATDNTKNQTATMTTEAATPPPDPSSMPT